MESKAKHKTKSRIETVKIMGECAKHKRKKSFWAWPRLVEILFVGGAKERPNIVAVVTLNDSRLDLNL